MEASEMKRMRELEEENAKLKRLFADVSLENQAMKDLFAKKGWWQQRKKRVLKALLLVVSVWCEPVWQRD